MNIYIPIETKARELESKLLLAMEAASRGHDVLLGPLSIIFSWGPTGLLKPGVFHDKSLSPTNSKISAFKKIKDKEGIITSLDEEGGFLSDSYNRFRDMRFSTETVGLADRIFCWGQFDFGPLTDKFPKFSEKFVLSGSPRVDLWSMNHGKRSVKVNQIEEGYILLISNLGYVLNKNRFWILNDHLKGYKSLSEDFSMENRLLKYSNDVLMLKEFIKLLKVLPQEFPGKTIVVRPHPVEDKQAWPSLVSGIENVQVIYEGGIDSWISNADVVIHNGCTSAFEARVKDVPLIAFTPEKGGRVSVSNTISLQAKNIDEVIKSIRSVLESSEQLQYSNKSNNLIEDRLYRDNRIGSYKLIVNEWEKLWSNKGLEKNNWLLIAIRLKASQFKKKIVPKLKRHDKPKGIDVSHKFPSLSKKEVENHIDSLKISAGFTDDFEVKEIFNKTFLIRSSSRA